MKYVLWYIMLANFVSVHTGYNQLFQSDVKKTCDQSKEIKTKKCNCCNDVVRDPSAAPQNIRVTHKYSKHRQEQRISVDLLNRLLANTAVMLIQTLHYHWNVKGVEFHDYHTLLDGQYKKLFEDLDLIAERVRAVGGNALGSMHEMLRHATLHEDTRTHIPHPKQMIINLHQQYGYQIEDIHDSIAQLENKTHDYGSRKMLEDLLEQYEKTAWMLKSLLEK